MRGTVNTLKRGNCRAEADPTAGVVEIEFVGYYQYLLRVDNPLHLFRTFEGIRMQHYQRPFELFSKLQSFLKGYFSDVLTTIEPGRHIFTVRFYYTLIQVLFGRSVQ